MNKKLINIVICMVVIILAIGFIFITQSNSINIEGVNFKIPDSYNAIDGENSINLTKNEDSIIISKNTSTDINKTVNQYIELKEKQNNTIKYSEHYINNINVCEVNVNENITHYWFEKNNKVFEIYTWTTNPKTNLIVDGLIESTGLD